jgi:ABC-type multidrug transport system fused ATPase/permease subunit
MYRSLVHILSQRRFILCLFLILQSLGSVAGAFEPLYIQRFISAVVNISDHSTRYILEIFLVLAILYLASGAAQGLAGYVMSVMSSGILKELRIAFFSKISRLPISYFRTVNQGEFVSKFNVDLGNTERLMSYTIPRFLFSLLSVITVLVILFMTCSVGLVFAGIAIAFLSSLLVLWLNKKIQKLAVAQREKYSEINRIFDETVQGIDALKMFVSEGRQLKKFQQFTDVFRGLTIKTARISSIFSTFIYGVMQYGNLLLLILIYFMISNRKLDLDTFLLFFFYLSLFQRSFKEIVDSFTNFQPILVSLSRLNQLFAETDEPSKAERETPLPAFDGADIRIENLSFSYNDAKAVFKNADMVVGNRETVVLVGPNGSGKTTLLNLLLRFYEPTGGRILLNQREIREYPLSLLRNMIRVVTQDYFIFEVSVRENITMADPNVSDEDVLKAIGKANLDGWYRNLPHGLDTVIGPRGKTISAGERQRLCFARAFLKKAPLLILDEPFANQDSESKKEILNVISLLRDKVTLLIISHQPIDSAFVDRWYYLDPDEMRFLERSITDIHSY